MEKRKPQYSLRDIKAAFTTVRALRITKSAADTALTLGISLEAIVEIIAEMTGKQFYKSMTSIANVRIWQDVYHVHYASLVLYIKFTKDPDGHLLVSFKER